MERLTALSGALTTSQVDAMPFLASFATPSGPLNADITGVMFILSLLAAYAGAIYFVFYCRRKRLDQAAA
jgi:hypothetical protein